MNFQCEFTSVCDLTCGYCPHKDMQRNATFMSDEVWEHVLFDYIVPYKDKNRFCTPTFIGHKDGEPLLNKKLPARLIDLSAAAPDMNIDIYSHGLMLPKWRERGNDFMEFLALLPNRVRYMMSYHPVNYDGSLNDYTETVHYLKRVLRDPPRNVEFITVSHKSKWVSTEVQESWRLLWNGLPITVHSNCSINPWTGRIEETTCHFNGCPYGDFGHMFFGVTGNVIACCMDLEEEIVFGNVLKDSPEAMVTALEQFYADQRAGNWKHQVCADCYGQKRNDLVQVGTEKVLA